MAHVDGRQDALAFIHLVTTAGGGPCSIAGTSCTVELQSGTARCDDCAALRALATKQDQVRYERRGDVPHVTSYRNVLVDGEELVLVLELGLPQFALPRKDNPARRFGPRRYSDPRSNARS